MIRHVVHDRTACRLTVEVDVGTVTLRLSCGYNDEPSSPGSSPPIITACVTMSASAARDRNRLSRVVYGLEAMAKIPDEVRGYGTRMLTPADHRISLDTIHRSIMDITRRPTA